MKLVFYSPILNNHQANVADELWTLTGHQYRFVELTHLEGAEHRKGDTRSYDDCPYLLRAWHSPEEYAEAMQLALTAEVCVFSSVSALPFQKERLRRGLLSFDMSERWLKRGLPNLLAPAIRKMYLAYLTGRWSRRPLYKLCCSSFAGTDHRRLGMYGGRCYKWGYFTRMDHTVPDTCGDVRQTDGTGCARPGAAAEKVETGPDVSTAKSGHTTSIMWCCRFLRLKHPELPILTAAHLRKEGYSLSLDMYGEGPFLDEARRMVSRLGLTDTIHFRGVMPNGQIMDEMRRHDIFLLTSDRNEGWGAVCNESMTAGCLLVASDGVGSAAYLIRHGENGMTFRSPATSSSIERPDAKSIDELCRHIEHLITHPDDTQRMRRRSLQTMHEEWNPRTAARRLLRLIECLSEGRPTPYASGPCSPA